MATARTNKTVQSSTKSHTKTSPEGSAATRHPEACYLRFLERAREVDARDVVPFRLDAVLAAHNVRVGVEAIRARKDDVKAQMPKCNWKKIEELPDLALALLHAAMLVDRTPEKTSVPQLLQTAKELRALMLGSAEALAMSGVVPEPEVARIRQGRGPIDMAADCTALAALFEKYAKAVAGKSPVTSDHIARAYEIGTTLLELLRPSGAKLQKNESAALKDAVDIRDRIHTLLIEQHDELWRVGAYLFGRNVDTVIPSLQTRVRSSSRSEEEEDVPPSGEEADETDDQTTAVAE